VGFRRFFSLISSRNRCRTTTNNHHAQCNARRPRHQVRICPRGPGQDPRQVRPRARRSAPLVDRPRHRRVARPHGRCRLPVRGAARRPDPLQTGERARAGIREEGEHVGDGLQADGEHLLLPRLRREAHRQVRAVPDGGSLRGAGPERDRDVLGRPGAQGRQVRQARTRTQGGSGRASRVDAGAAERRPGHHRAPDGIQQGSERLRHQHGQHPSHVDRSAPIDNSSSNR
ncbi:hypothetical protein PENTCL1PPCAC_21676, partial [Pristionchus entomophagus]